VRGAAVREGLSEIRSSLVGLALGNYVSALIGGLPSWLLPVIVVEQLRPSTAALFYTSWMIVTLVNTGSAALATGFLVAGVRQRSTTQHLLRKAYTYALLYTIPATLVLVVAAHPVMRVFGRDYAEGVELLRYLALAGVPYAFVQINLEQLRLTSQLRLLGALTTLQAVVTLGGSYLVLPTLGLTGIGMAWMASCLLVGGVSQWLVFYFERARQRSFAG
jgi:O-antigen/teichoic acid export membrane protein